jgi:hypothetical protein
MRRMLFGMLLALGFLMATSTVTQAGNVYTNVWLSASPNPSSAGQTVSFTDQVIAPCTGTITFLDGTNTIGTGDLDTGYATLQISSLVAGTHSITAAYPGSWLCQANVSAALNQVITSPAPTITSLSPTQGGQGTQFTITGTGFGDTQGTSRVTVNGVTASVVSNGWTATSITVQVPSNSAGSGGVVVTVSNVPSNSHAFTVTSGFGCS